MHVVNPRQLGEIDFSSILKDITGAYASAQQAKSARDIVKYQTQAQIAQAQQNQAYSLLPQYSPTYASGGTTGINWLPIILVGGGILALYFLMKD